ncbi:MAG TPA: (2Fe-2S)-binding protein [Candidatus Methylomirabilis sp.]|nr:(2Fe-2S)-binding protein [Candidatus Methylomirabilis sp.]
MSQGKRVTQGVQRGERIEIVVDGERVEAFLGETVAAALIAAGRPILRRTDRSNAPRGVYCGIGVCFDCLVGIDDRPRVRACQTPVAPGMRVDTQGRLVQERWGR